MRTLTKDTVNKSGQPVVLMGWVANRRDHGKLIFIDLRDRWGIVQVVFNPKDAALFADAERLRSEWVVKIEGRVRERPAGMENAGLATGRVEVEATTLEIIAESKTPPFALDTDGYEVGEEHRLKYRYLDLRRERLKKNLLMRYKVIAFIRDWLHKRDFVEIETPILTKSTPEGARDYVVPSRLYPGKFYALPQSPQQYKQLLMVAGLERYFQIARCFRDEDTRGDRQPEFTQLDIEMSFVEQEEILQLAEDLFMQLVVALFPEKHLTSKPFQRIPYLDAMDKHKTDKPDLRKNPSDPNELAFAFITDFPMFEWKEREKRWDAVHHPFTMGVPQEKGEPSGVDSHDRERIRERMWEYVKEGMLEAARSGNGETGLSVGMPLTHQYDLVLNGYEVGSGSVREHNPKILMDVFEIMGHSRTEVESKFGHLFHAFEHGVPPHGGIAPGIDRLLMILQGEPNIREVIAFPKTGDGRDLMMEAPAELEKKQLKELGVEATEVE